MQLEFFVNYQDVQIPGLAQRVDKMVNLHRNQLPSVSQFLKTQPLEWWFHHSEKKKEESKICSTTAERTTTKPNSEIQIGKWKQDPCGEKKFLAESRQSTFFIEDYYITISDSLESINITYSCQNQSMKKVHSTISRVQMISLIGFFFQNGLRWYFWEK